MVRLAVIAATVALAAPVSAIAGVNPQVAGLQVALRAHGLYLAQIDGVAGPRTAAAVHAFQRQHDLRVGPADVRTRLALGPLGRPVFGSRLLNRGDFGFDVAVLQFILTRRGVYSGALDGYFGKETAGALRRYQRLMRLDADAVVGPRTLSAIVRRERVPVREHLTPPPAPVVVHVVHPGDTLTALARSAGTTIAGIASLNGIDPGKPILIGQRLRLPARAATLAPAASDVRAKLDAWSARLGVDPHLVRALAWMESGFQTRIVSSAGARGVLQTLPTTRAYVETVLVGRRVPMTVDGDIEVGILYLRHLLQVFRGDQRLALAGWYQGERAVRERGVYKVSKPFVANVLALRSRM
ncbi:MAG TPA: peptidoglycan-binding protein [Gaiellaceae bacterium]|jgi:peptidoglycan hydrolase-like protein with peptidoglycan-binding domain